jgi:hypothetical protein
VEPRIGYSIGDPVHTISVSENYQTIVTLILGLMISIKQGCQHHPRRDHPPCAISSSP